MPNTLVLRALTGDLRGQEFAVTGSAHWILGRSRSCSLRLPGDATVSRQHCLIEMDTRGVWVQDLGSLNGTLINGTRISRGNAPCDPDATCVESPRQELADGDELRICNNVFAVCLQEAEPAPSRKDTMRWVVSSPEVQHALVG
jgi:pSer/pThr/pTyr-binding forkhead associated (FHA) protein